MTFVPDGLRRVAAIALAIGVGLPVAASLAATPPAGSVELGDWTAPSYYQHGPLKLVVSGAALSDDPGGAIAVWANSPEAQLTVTNSSAGFYHGKLRWHNVPAGSYLEAGRRVAEAATANAGTLQADLSLAGGGSRTFHLEPNFRRDFRFAICLSPERVLHLLPKSGGQRPQFAVELGGQGLDGAVGEVSGLGFPTYLMPGIHDSDRLVRQRIGGAYGAFGVGPDRLLLLDDRAHYLGATQVGWLKQQLQAFKQEGVRRTFVCLLVAPHDPRLHHRDGLSNRHEARRVAHMLRAAHVTALFAGTGTRSYTRTWYGIPEYLLSETDGIVVENKNGNLSIRLAVH